jgi:hypothetical protein
VTQDSALASRTSPVVLLLEELLFENEELLEHSLMSFDGQAANGAGTGDLRWCEC